MTRRKPGDAIGRAETDERGKAHGIGPEKGRVEFDVQVRPGGRCRCLGSTCP